MKSIPFLAILLTTTAASAHVSISSGPAQANKSQKIVFGVGHGCDGFDTFRVTVDVPAGVTSVRALRSDFGTPTMTRDGSDNVTAVTWEKPAAELLASDEGYYELTIRARIPDVAFTQLQWNVRQVCLDADDNEIVVDWDQPPGSTTGEPAPIMTVVPSRLGGWNQYTLGAAIAEADVPTYFGDAQIVWRGTDAYSPNAAIATLIGITPGVGALTSLAAGDEVWVKY